MLCASMDAYAGDASEALSMYSINGGQMTLIRYPNLLRRLNLFIELLMDHTDHRRIEVCQDLASLALKYSSESDQFGKVMFQFLLGDSFDSLHLGGSVPIMTGPVQESSKSIKEQAPLQSVYVFEDRFKTQHIVDSSITDFDFFPEQNAVISARSSVVFYTCRVLEFTDREVLVKWETDGKDWRLLSLLCSRLIIIYFLLPSLRIQSLASSQLSLPSVLRQRTPTTSSQLASIKSCADDICA